MMKTMSLLLLAFLLAGNSCKKENAKTEDGFVDGLLLDGGPVVNEDCGWIIKVNEAYYSPINLSSEFKKDNSTVQLKYKLLKEDFICGNTTTFRSYKQIEITEIKNKKPLK